MADIPDVTVPPPPLQLARRIFVWTVGAVLLGLWGAAIYFKQDQWAIASIMGLLIFSYVMAGSAEMVTQIVSNSGVAKAVLAASTAASQVAATIGQGASAVGGMITQTTTTTAPATPAAAPPTDADQRGE